MRATFTQYYGSEELDASTLTIPLVGFLPATDERVGGTIDAVIDGLARDRFVSRYSTADTDDGLPGDEGQFLACRERSRGGSRTSASTRRAPATPRSISRRC